MTMPTITKNALTLVLGIFLFSTTAFSADNGCYSGAELNNFKDIYIKLQQQLNYEGTDAYLDKNFKVQVKPHEKDTPYGGKVFEEAIFAEYQNSLKKVGRLYQAAKFENDDSFKSNDLLVKFLAAIDDKSSDSSEFIQKTKVKEVIKALEDASIKKFGNSADKKYVLNSGDKYLLEKLLTHAQDRICNLATFEKTGKDTFYFKADYLQKVKNAPLSRLVNTLKHASISKDSKIDIMDSSPITGSLIDPDVAIKSAVTENINKLSEWVKNVKKKGDKCLQSLKSKQFANSIQANVQSCNLGHFIDTLSDDNVSNLEAILHFINSNERLLNFAQAKAETALDDLTLESFIDKTFANLGTKISCTIVKGPGNKNKIFVRNLPFINNKFDSSKVTCKIKDKELKANDCASKIEFVSDDLGRGVEVKQKSNSGAAVSLFVTENPDCSDIGLGEETPEKIPVQENSKLDQTVHDLFEDEDCKNIGLSEYPFEEQMKNPKGPGCIPRPKDKPLLEPVKDFTTVETENCEEKTKADKDKKVWILNKTTNKCEEASENDKCKIEADKKDSKVPMKFDETMKKCVEDKDSSKEEADCKLKNQKFSDENGRPILKYVWNSDKKTCDDKRPDKKDSGKKSDEDKDADDDPAVAPKQPPGRFQPINNNFARPMWVSPGAP